MVPDTNAIFGVVTAGERNPQWQRLLGLSAAEEIAIVLPEIVQWELVNQLRERLTRDLGELASRSEKLRRRGLTPPAFADGEAQAAKIVAAAGERLRQTVLWHRGRIAPAPSVDSVELVRRSLERRPPFDLHDRGLRDTILWLTVLDIAAQGDTVILVSDDHRAFGESQLLPDLRDEAATRCEDPMRVVLAADCDAALRIVHDRTSAARRAAEAWLDDSDALADVMMHLATSAAGETVDRSGLARAGWPSELLRVEVEAVLEFSSVSIDRAEVLAAGELLLQLRIGAFAELDARHEQELEYNDWMDLVRYAEIVDVGLINPSVQVTLRREIDLVGRLVLRAAKGGIMDVSLTDIQLARRTVPHGQRRLELPPVS